MSRRWEYRRKRKYESRRKIRRVCNVLNISNSRRRISYSSRRRSRSESKRGAADQRQQEE